MSRLCTFLILLILLLVAPQSGHAETSDRAAHPRALIEALDDEALDMEALVHAHFSARLIAEHGEEHLVGLIGMLRDDLVPVQIRAIKPGEGDKVELHLDSGDMGSLVFSVVPGPEPDFLVDGFAIVPLAAGPLDRAELPATLAQAVAGFMKQHAEETAFSGAVLVAQDEQVLYAQAFGMADRASKRPNTLDTAINLGSMNKMFTGVAIAQLVQRRLLSYDDTVGKHLPDYPDAEVREQVTVHQLLTHTSGLGVYWNDKYLQRKAELDTVAEFAELFAGEPLAFAPGAQFSYSNNGPVVLGLIIEKISGKDYYQYVRDHIYKPAGMLNSDHYLLSDTAAKFALGYLGTGPNAQDNNEEMALRGSPAGGGYASANDMLRFARALLDGKLLGQEQLREVTTGKVDMGPGVRYGYLFGDHEDLGQRFFGHNGGAPGISAEFSVYPDRGITVVVLANLDRAAAAPARMIRRLVAAYD